jgi:MFS family permease
VRVVFASTGLMAAATVLFVALPTNSPLWPLGIVFGLGYGGFTSADWALAVDALPSPRAAGKDMGLWGMASTLPGVLAPAIGGLVIFAFGRFGAIALGYRCVFALASFSLLLGAAFVLKIRLGAAPCAEGDDPTRDDEAA